MSYIERIVKGGTVVFIMIVLGTILGYLFRLYLSRLMTVEEFGLFYSVLTFIGLLIMIGTFGLGSSLIKHIPEFIVKKRMDNVKSGIIYVILLQAIIMLVLTAIIFLLSDFLATEYFGNPNASVVLKLLSVYAVFSVFLNTTSTSFTGLGRVINFSSISPTQTFLALMIVFFIGANAVNASYAYLFSSMITFIVFFFLLTRATGMLKSKLTVDKNLAKKIFLFSVPLFFLSIMDILINSADTLILTYFRTLEEVGFYQAALPTSRLLLVFYSSIILIIFPMFSEMRARNKGKDISITLSIVLKYVLILLMPFVLILISFPDIVIRMLFGSKYLPAAPALQILSASVVFLSLYSIISTVFVSIGKVGIVMKITFLITLLNIVLNIVLIPFLGIVGASLASLSSFLIAFILYFYFIEKEVRLAFKTGEFIKIIVLSIFALLSISILKSILIMDPWFELIISLLVSLTLYAFLLIFCRIVTKKDLKILSEANVWIPEWFKKFISKIIN